MKLPIVEGDKWDAIDKYREYAAAAKRSDGYFKQKNAWYKELKKLYYQMKLGKKVVDIPAILKLAGLYDDDGTPKMAIAPIDAKYVHCRMESSGRVIFRDTNFDWHWKVRKTDFNIEHCYAGFPYSKHNAHGFELKAPVPLVPPQYIPQKPMNDLYVLWEVDVWENVAPLDPWLLRRITDTHCVLLQGWNLTELERSVMNAHI